MSKWVSLLGKLRFKSCRSDWDRLKLAAPVMGAPVRHPAHAVRILVDIRKCVERDEPVKGELSSTVPLNQAGNKNIRHAVALYNPRNGSAKEKVTGRTCDRAFVEAVMTILSGFGYEVTHNKHFSGAECIHKHSDPAGGVHSLQIETRRGLYMNETTYERGPDFETVRGHLSQLAAQLADYTRQHTRSIS